MSEDLVNLSLDDIIKKKKTPSNNYSGGRGRGGRTNFRQRGGRGEFRGKPPQRYNNERPYSVPSRADRIDRWQTDLFKPDTSRRGGRLNSGGGSKLNISNLDYGVSDSDIEELFSEFGPIKKAGVHYDFSGRSKGTAEVIYFNSEGADKAFKQYNGVPLDGRPMHIEVVTAGQQQPLRRFGNVGNRQNQRGQSFSRRGNDFRGGKRNTSNSATDNKTQQPTVEELDAQLDLYLSENKS